MSYYRICPHCGAHLDPGEVCDCQISAALLLTEGAAEHWGDKKELPGAANTEQLKAEKVLTGSDSASIINENGGFVK